MDTPSNMPPVDPEILEMLASLQEPGEPDILVELLTLFLRDSPPRLGELAARPLRAPVAARVAHAIKGSAGNLGAAHLQQLAGDLEDACRHEAADLQPLVTQLMDEYARVALYLHGVIAERPGEVSPQDATAARVPGAACEHLP